MPTPTTGPASESTGIPAHAVTGASNAERDSNDRTKVAVQPLFDTWNRALRDDDAALFHSVLTRELAGSCGLDELQSWLDQDDEFLAEAVVSAVFLDVTDPTRAFAELAAGQRAARPEEAIPCSMARGAGRRRMAGRIPRRFDCKKMPVRRIKSTLGAEGGEREFSQIPGLDLERRENISEDLCTKHRQMKRTG